MILDTSAFLAILQGEPEADALTCAIANDSIRMMSVASWLEVSMVAFQRGRDAALRDVDLLVAKYGVEIASVTPVHGIIARDAFTRYGKGFHPARLNFGDCLAYSLAKDSGESLLFKGDDFTLTDIVRASY